MWVLIFNRVWFMRALYVKNISRTRAGELVRQNQWPEDRYKGANSLLVREFLARRTHDRELDGFILDETVMGYAPPWTGTWPPSGCCRPWLLCWGCWARWWA